MPSDVMGADGTGWTELRRGTEARATVRVWWAAAAAAVAASLSTNHLMILVPTTAHTSLARTFEVRRSCGH